MEPPAIGGGEFWTIVWTMGKNWNKRSQQSGDLGQVGPKRRENWSSGRPATAGEPNGAERNGTEWKWNEAIDGPTAMCGSTGQNSWTGQSARTIKKRGCTVTATVLQQTPNRPPDRSPDRLPDEHHLTSASRLLRRGMASLLLRVCSKSCMSDSRTLSGSASLVILRNSHMASSSSLD